jgi:hypothetical protein
MARARFLAQFILNGQSDSAAAGPQGGIRMTAKDSECQYGRGGNGLAMMLERIEHMLIEGFLQTLRDPRMRLLIFGAPIIILLVFGYAATSDVQHIATAVYDLDNSVGSRDMVSRFVESRYFDVVE